MRAVVRVRINDNHNCECQAGYALFSKMFLAARRNHNRNNNHNYTPILRSGGESPVFAICNKLNCHHYKTIKLK